MRTRTRSVLVILLLLSGPAGAWAQGDPIPDTLDWHGYFPLAEGNAWQWFHDDFEDPFGTVNLWYETWTVSGDTQLAGQDYFTIRNHCVQTFLYVGLGYDACRFGEYSTMYLRYDEDGSNVFRYSSQSDSPDDYLWGYDFRLDANFNSEGPSPGGFAASYWYTGEFNYELPGLTTTTVKSIGVSSAIPGGLAFAYGLGLVDSGYNEGGGQSVQLLYAKIGGQEYGTYNPVANEPISIAPATELGVYPNPASSLVKVHYALDRSGAVTLRVYDALGRVVLQKTPGWTGRGAGSLVAPLGGLGSGSYFVELVVDGAVLGRRQLTVIR